MCSELLEYPTWFLTTFLVFCPIPLYESGLRMGYFLIGDWHSLIAFKPQPNFISILALYPSLWPIVKPISSSLPATLRFRVILPGQHFWNLHVTFTKKENNPSLQCFPMPLLSVSSFSPYDLPLVFLSNTPLMIASIPHNPSTAGLTLLYQPKATTLTCVLVRMKAFRTNISVFPLDYFTFSLTNESIRLPVFYKYLTHYAWWVALTYAPFLSTR